MLILTKNGKLLKDTFEPPEAICQFRLEGLDCEKCILYTIQDIEVGTYLKLE